MRALIVVAGFGLAACQTPCPAPGLAPASAIFECEDGSQLRVVFTYTPDVARVQQEGYVTVDLPARITGSGYRYAAYGAELARRAGEVHWTRPGASETICRQAT